MNLIERAEGLDAQYVFATATFDGSSPVLGLFEGSHMQYEAVVRASRAWPR